MKIGIYSYKKTSKNKRAVEVLTGYFKKLKIPAVLNPASGRGLNLAISVGGDGALARTARKMITVSAGEIPVCGYNTGSFGFLCPADSSNYRKTLGRIIAGKTEPYRISSVVAEINGKAAEAACQDIVVRSGAARCIDYIAGLASGAKTNITADGFMVSNVTGASGYSLACGNPFVLPGMDFFIISFINPHKLTARNIIVPPECPVNLEICGDNGNVYLSLDGQVSIKLKIGDRLKIRKGAAYGLYLPDGAGFFRRIKEYFSFGKRKIKR